MHNFPELRQRQVHLDFHTSEYIPDVGKEFDEKQFIAALRAGHVNSVTAFAVCHHGWSYYPTRVGECHPQLKTDLLPRMLAAARQADIDMPIYITFGWNERIGRLHPEWVVKDIDGREMDWSVENGRRVKWKRICPNTPYLDHVLEVTREVMELYHPIGIFYDIIFVTPCYCDTCRKLMREQGIDLADRKAVEAFTAKTWENVMSRVTDLIWSIDPACRVYWNSNDRKNRQYLSPYYSHYEIESLPTTDWCGGYEHFPQTARYFHHCGFDFLGMTGKFHESWGEFGGFKSVPALRYECMRMLMLGAKCSIGDQMMPSGRLDPATYDLIGAAYSELEQKEVFCRGMHSCCDIAVLAPSAAAGSPAEFEDAEVGASMMLTETGRVFDIIDPNADFSGYRLLILPDEVAVDSALRARLDRFSAAGGLILASGNSGRNLDCGVEVLGESPWYIDYTQVGEQLAPGLVSACFFNHIPAVRSRLTDGEVLAKVAAPYFNRTVNGFCSHGNTPCSGRDAGYPGVVRKGNTIYFAHRIFTDYRNKGMKLHRDLVSNAIALLDRKPLLKLTGLPSGGMSSLMRRDNVYMLHLLYATPIKRGAVEVIEDIVTVRDIGVELRLPGVKAVVLQPSGQKLDFSCQDGVCRFTVPELELHQMVEITTA